VADFCEHGNEPSGSIKKAGCCFDKVTVSFSKNALHHIASKYILLDRIRFVGWVELANWDSSLTLYFILSRYECG
jgi:hypothetical protein